MRVLVAVAVAMMVLAGCSDAPEAQTQSAEPEIDYGVEATSTTGVIRGYVVDEAIRPIVNVAVTLQALNQTKTTTDDGAFGFQDLEPGTYFLSASKQGFTSVQTSVEVIAGDSAPPVTKISLVAVPSEQPYVEAFATQAYITCGLAVVATSVGCSTFPDVGRQLGDNVYFFFEFSTLPMWTQGELVWQQTQPAGGAMIWEIIDPNQGGTPQSHTGYRETAASPALAYINTTLLAENEEWVVGEGNGVQYRIFAGPHPTCTGVGFGCGLTLQQQMTAYVHNFFNFAPEDGWRFTVDGEPVPPL